jgi:hypothetical protein
MDRITIGRATPLVGSWRIHMEHLLERIQTMFLPQFRVLISSTYDTLLFVSFGHFAYRNMGIRLGNSSLQLL